jgi:hypothetical protein
MSSDVLTPENMITIYGIWYIRYADSEAALVNFCCNTSLTTGMIRFCLTGGGNLLRLKPFH